MGNPLEDLLEWVRADPRPLSELLWEVFNSGATVHPPSYERWIQLRNQRATYVAIQAGIRDAMLADRIDRIVMWANIRLGASEGRAPEIDGNPLDELSRLQRAGLLRHVSADEAAGERSDPLLQLGGRERVVSTFTTPTDFLHNATYQRARALAEDELRRARRSEENRTSFEILSNRVYQAIEAGAVLAGPEVFPGRRLPGPVGSTGGVVRRAPIWRIGPGIVRGANVVRGLAPPLEFPVVLADGMTAAGLRVLLRRVWDEVALLRQLHHARQLSGQAMQRETLSALHAFETRFGTTVQFVDEGVVQTLTSQPGVNFATLQGNRLMIERQILNDPRRSGARRGTRSARICSGALAALDGFRRSPACLSTRQSCWK
jgi:hypothetical protein